MNEEVRRDIIRVLRKSVELLKSSSCHYEDNLSALSNQTIHNASIFQDEDSISIAVIMYSLSKMVSRHEIKDELINRIEHAYHTLEKSNLGSYNKEIKGIIEDIKQIDGKVDFYIQEVINNAQIKKGGKIYDHGISLSRAAHLLGINQWELMSYVGKTKIIDRSDKDDQLLIKRVENARDIFGLE
jgi:hypothetical protein